MFEPRELDQTTRYMLWFLRQKGSKVRNALRNLLWRHLTKRQATKLVELSAIPEHTLNKRVSRITLQEVQTIHGFIRETTRKLAEGFMFKNSYAKKTFERV